MPEKKQRLWILGALSILLAITIGTYAVTANRVDINPVQSSTEALVSGTQYGVFTYASSTVSAQQTLFHFVGETTLQGRIDVGPEELGGSGEYVQDRGRIVADFILDEKEYRKIPTFTQELQTRLLERPRIYVNGLVDDPFVTDQIANCVPDEYCASAWGTSGTTTITVEGFTIVRGPGHGEVFNTRLGSMTDRP